MYVFIAIQTVMIPENVFLGRVNMIQNIVFLIVGFLFDPSSWITSEQELSCLVIAENK